MPLAVGSQSQNILLLRALLNLNCCGNTHTQARTHLQARACQYCVIAALKVRITATHKMLFNAVGIDFLRANLCYFANAHITLLNFFKLCSFWVLYGILIFICTSVLFYLYIYI